MLLAILSCVVLVVEFYIGIFGASFGLELFYTSFFIIDYVLRLLSSIDRLRFFFGFWNLADLLSIMPVVLVFFPEESHTAAGGLLRLLRVSRALRILRAFRFVSARQTGVVSVQQEIILIMFTLANMIFIFSCLILEFERQFSPVPAVESFPCVDLLDDCHVPSPSALATSRPSRSSRR
jgi:voltage-gated potassium channel